MGGSTPGRAARDLLQKSPVEMPRSTGSETEQRDPLAALQSARAKGVGRDGNSPPGSRTSGAEHVAAEHCAGAEWDARDDRLCSWRSSKGRNAASSTTEGRVVRSAGTALDPIFKPGMGWRCCSRAPGARASSSIRQVLARFCLWRGRGASACAVVRSIRSRTVGLPAQLVFPLPRPSETRSSLLLSLFLRTGAVDDDQAIVGYGLSIRARCAFWPLRV